MAVLSLAVWLAAGAGVTHLLKAGLIRVTELFRLAELSRQPQIYVIAAPRQDEWSAPPAETQNLGWAVPSPSDRWKPGPIQYESRQLPAQPSWPASLDITVPTHLASYQASEYLDEVLRSAGVHFEQIRLRRGQSIAMDALARAAQARGLAVRWVTASQFSDSGWVIERA